MPWTDNSVGVSWRNDQVPGYTVPGADWYADPFRERKTRDYTPQSMQDTETAATSKKARADDLMAELRRLTALPTMKQLSPATFAYALYSSMSGAMRIKPFPLPSTLE